LLSAIGSIVVFRRIFHGRWEQIFWTSFLVVIAAFYLSFAAYFEASTHAWQLRSSALPFSLLVPWVGCFLDRLSPLAMSCMGCGIYPIVCPALHLRACR